MNDYILETTEGFDRVRHDPPWPSWLEPVVELNRKLGAMPLVGGNDAVMWADNQVSLEAMIAEIGLAEKTIHVEFYILSLDDTTARSSMRWRRRTSAGVRVRVLLDHLGSFRVPGLSPHHPAAQGDGRAVAPHAAVPAAGGSSSSAPTCATTASCSSSTARSRSRARRT